MESMIRFGLSHRVAAVLAAVALLWFGGWSIVRLPIDAVPDVTNVQVQVNTAAPALSPLEMERQVTLPVERALAGIPHVDEVRSLSQFGLSQVTVVFHEGTDIYFARQQIQERLGHAMQEIPDGIPAPEMGPVSTGLGEIFQYRLRGEGLELTELRAIQDWVVAPALRTVPGVAEVSAFGGEVRPYEVRVLPERLRQFDIPLDELISAVRSSTNVAGGGYLVRGSEQMVVSGVAAVRSIEDVAGVVVASRNGVPIRVGDLAEVTVGAMIRQGAVTHDGEGEAVIGIVMMRMGENARVVTHGLRDRIAELSTALPAGVGIEAFHDRTELVDRTIRTVRNNLIEGALLVTAVLLLMLGHLRVALVVALTIPLAMAVAAGMMVEAGIAGSLMSLGALDFGLLVDGSVVMAENSLRHLQHRREGESKAAVISRACREVARPVVFGIAIIIVVYLPVLTLEGVEGRMFRPMALTVIFALIGALLVSLLIIPSLLSFGEENADREPAFIARLRSRYEGILSRVLDRPAGVLAAAAVSLVMAVAGFRSLGSEFLPRLDEGALALQVQRLPGVSLEESIRQMSLIERHLVETFPDEIVTVVSKTGRPEVATDPMGVNLTDVIIPLRPRKEWTAARTKDELEAAVAAEMERFPGTAIAVTQPIELRVNELIAGVRSDFAVKVYGEDLEVIGAVAAELAEMLNTVPGAAGFIAPSMEGTPQLEIRPDPALMARHGITAGDIVGAVEAIGGIEAATVLEGQRRVGMVVRWSQQSRSSIADIDRIPVRTSGGAWLALGAVASIEEVVAPLEVRHESGMRVAVVEGNIRGRDMGSFVDEVRERLRTGSVAIPSGVRLSFGGQFENLERASARLAIVVPLSLGLIMALLYGAFGSMRPALLVFTGVPLAVVGGIAALVLRGMPFSIPAGVGFIALSGIAVLNGLVMVTAIRQLRDGGMPLPEAVREGAATRLRPVLTTAAVAAIGFVPMALSTGAGAEVQRPLATVVIGGLVSSTLLTLLVLPVLAIRGLSAKSPLDGTPHT